MNADDDMEFLDDVSKQANALGQAFVEKQANITRLQSLHDELEARWLKEKSEFDEIVFEGNSLVSQLCVSEEERGKIQKNISILEKDIEKTTTEYETTRRKVIGKTNEYENLKREVSDYALKMNDYTKVMTEVESNTPLVKQVAQVKSEIELLRIKKTDLERWKSGVLTDADGIAMTEEQLNTQLMELKQQAEERRDAYEDKKKELESVQQKRKGMKMTNFVLTKRNSALLIRMKRKVEEQKQKYSTLVSQRDYLVKMVDTTKQKLGRFDGSQ